MRSLLASKRNRLIVVDGLAGSAASMLFAKLPRRKQPYLIIANDLDEAGYIYNDLCQILDDKQVLIFPSGYKRDIKYGQVDPPNEILRTEVLSKWHSQKGLHCVVTFPEALAEKVCTREMVDKATIHIEVNATLDLTETGRRLRDFGFREVDYVYEPGQFALRGSILDVFSFSHELPYRIDFFGDEIDSIRTFNVETQLSQEQLDSIDILNNSGSAEAGTSFIEFAGTDTLLICRDVEWLRQRVKAITEESISSSTLIAEEGDAHALGKVVDFSLFNDALDKCRRIDFSYGESAAKGNAKLSLNCTPQGIYHKNFDLISQSFHDFLEKGYRICILSDSPKQIERLRLIFEDRHDNIAFTPVEHTLHEGFVDHDLKLCVFTDHQIFDRFHKYNLKSDRARSGKLALSLKELNQIEVGDYIVHEDHGIGKFGGLVRTGINGTMQEMIKLTYLNGDIIFVSIHALHKLSKYRGKEGVEPRLNKLGSGAWNRMKNRTKSKLKDIARDLIRLYAKRREEKGFAFSPDGYLQQELEAS
ncbi:MAG: transcription-repair coupling factor, partial [Muribaculaceae bacterium]|nr:transcription-repair coupling factor [Muribaculaceae bacterium]